MRDDFLARDYADHHRTLSRAIHKLAHRTAIAFEKLAAYRYAAPWRPAVTRNRGYRTPAASR